MFLMILIGGLPITLLMPGVRFFDSLGGMAPQAMILFIMVAAVYVALMFKWKFLISQGLKYKALILFFLYCAISLTWSENLVYGLRMFIKLVAPFLFFVAFQAFFRDYRDINLGEKMVFLCCLIVLAIAILNHITNGVFSPDPVNIKWIRLNQLTTPYMSPANFSFLIGCGAILALANFLVCKKFRYFILYIIFSAAVFMAFTRISMAGLVVTRSCVYMLSRSKAIKILLPASILIIFILSFFFIKSMQDRMFMDRSLTLSIAINDPEKLHSSVGTSGRALLWKDAKRERYIEQNPLIGGGIGSVDAWLDNRVNPISPDRLHSEYLRIGCDTGLVGLALYVISILYFFTQLLKLQRLAKDWNEKKYHALAISMLGYYTITLATDNSLNYVSEFGMYVFLFMAFSFVSTKQKEQDVERVSRDKIAYSSSADHAPILSAES